MKTLVFICAILAEILAIHLTLFKEGFGMFLGAHLFSSFLIIGTYAEKYRKSKIRNLRLVLIALWTCLPLVGWLIALTLAIYLRRNPEPLKGTAGSVMESLDLDERDPAHGVDTLESTPIKDYAKKSFKNELAARPFIDILGSDNISVKKKVIAKLRGDRSWEAIKLLKLAQRDPLYDIQYLSTVALSAIETEWSAQLKRLNAEIAIYPLDVDLRNEAVTLYMLIHGSQLLPDGICRIYLNNARKHLEVSLSQKPKQPDILLYKGKIDLFFCDYEGAKEAFEQALSLQPENINFRIWRAEAFYLLKDFESLAKESRELESMGGVPEKVKESVRYWSQYGA